MATIGGWSRPSSFLYFANKADVEGHTDVAALFRATMLIEYADEQERRVALTKLKGIKRKTWVQVEGTKKVYAIADEDLERENETKTSAVHFMRVPLSEEMAAALKCASRSEWALITPSTRTPWISRLRRATRW